MTGSIQGHRIGTTALMAAAVLSLPLSAMRAQPAPSHDFTLKQVLSAPFPSSLVAAPQGGRAAWVYDAEGVRNVWVAGRAADGSYRSRPVTAYTGDNGDDLGELSWDGAGHTVAYTRGGSLEGGDSVNIMSLAGGAPTQAVWTASIDGSAPRQVGPGHSAAISPRGDVIAYLSGGGQVWTAPLAGGTSSPLLHDRGEDSALTWSPDGTRLAFVSTRTDHSLIGVYDTASHLITWVQPSFDTDQAPEWSPDGRGLAFVRVPAGAANSQFNHRQGQPWSIWIADPATGAAHRIWMATLGPGSVFYPLLGERVLMWGAGDRIVFPWEQTGWAHLYAVPAAGGLARELTPGAREVFNTALSPDRSRIVYSTNAEETDRWHLWEVAVAGGIARALTHGTSIEDYPVLCSDGQVLALHGSARDPMRPVRIADGTTTDLAPGAIPADFPSARLVEPQPVVFAAADGLAIHAQLFLPLSRRRAPGPALLFFHGGPSREMLLGWHPIDAYSFMYAMNQYLADEGYVVLSVNYRGGIGYGLDFRAAPNFGANGASELNDILGAALYLRSRPDVDPARVGIWGGSYGGLMTALGLSRASGLLAAGVDYAGVHDWRTLLPSLDRAGAPAGAGQLAFDSSAVATVDQWRSPVLLVHADDDRNVPFSQSVELLTALRKRGVDVEQLVIPDEIHDLLREHSWLTFFDATDDFFARHLAPSKTPTRP